MKEEALYNALIGAASGWGARERATERAPFLLYERDLPLFLQERGVPSFWREIVKSSKSMTTHEVPVGKPSLPLIVEHCTHLAHTVEQTLRQGFFPTILGGDHSVAVGTWQGVTQALNARGAFGLIWFDAHMDGHTPATTPSYAYHGMPVAVLLGHGEEELVHLNHLPGPTLRPQDLVLMGVRSFEEGEEQLLKRLGVRIYYMDELQERGFGTCLDEAVTIVTRHTKGFGLSLDLDGFDPSIAPGVGSPAPGGLYPDEVLPALARLKEHETFRALEIVEFNPDLDIQEQTYFLIRELLASLLPC